MSKLETEEKKEWINVDYTNTSAYRTVKAWNKIAGIYEKGGPTGVTGGIPRDEWSQLKKLKRLDLTLKAEKGPIQKIITSMARQIIRQPDEKGLLVPKECLTVQGVFKGTDWADMDIEMAFYEGWNKKPIMGKMYLNPSKRFDPETGEDLGKVDVKRSTIEYFYEVPQEKKERKKYIDSIIENAYGSFAENILYYYKELGPGNAPNSSIRNGTFSYEEFSNYSIEQLRDLSHRGGGSKGPGYYRDSDGKLRDRNNNLVSNPDDNKKNKDVYQ